MIMYCYHVGIIFNGNQWLMTESKYWSPLIWLIHFEAASIIPHHVSCYFLYLLDLREHEEGIVNCFLNHFPSGFRIRRPKNRVLDRESSTGLQLLLLRNSEAELHFPGQRQNFLWLYLDICKLFVRTENHGKCTDRHDRKDGIDVRRDLF